jgi:hypothetical protein
LCSAFSRTRKRKIQIDEEEEGGGVAHGLRENLTHGRPDDD